MHFTFADGALGFDCVRCGSRCCHGLGFGLGQDELIPFIGKAPKLAPFLQLKDYGADSFDLSDGCWMLEPDGRCGLEVQHGRSAKPSVCRLFPLHARLIGGQLMVDLRLLHCPLEDASGLGQGATVLRHDEAAAEVAELAKPFAREVSLPAAAPDDLLAKEAQIRDTAHSLRGLEDPAVMLARAHSADESALITLRNRWRRFFAVESAASGVTGPVALSLSSLRMAALTAPGAQPWPRLQRFLVGQLLANSFYVELSALAGRRASVRGTAEIWRSTASVRELLARWGEPRRVPEGAPEGAPAEIARAYEQVQVASGPIGDALEATTLPPPLRPLLVRALADRLL